MDKLIIAITCDSTMSYPSNPNNPTPKGIEAVAADYVRSVNAGASICHLHGPYTVDAKIQADGTKLSDLDIPGWHKLRSGITDNVEIKLGVNNVADQQPRLYAPNVQSGTDPSVFDVIGRRVFGQLRLRF